ITVGVGLLFAAAMTTTVLVIMHLSGVKTTSVASLRELFRKGPIVIDEAPPETRSFPSRFWAAVVSPDGKTLATTGGGYNFPNEAGELVLWDLATGKEKLIRRQPITIRSMAFSHNGKQIAFGDFAGTTTVIDSATGKA